MQRNTCSDLVHIFVYDSQTNDVEDLARHAKFRSLFTGFIFVGLIVWFIVLAVNNDISSFYTTDTVLLVWNQSVVHIVPDPVDPTLDQCIARPAAANISWSGGDPWRFRAQLASRWYFPQWYFLFVFLGITLTANFIRAGMNSYFARLMVTNEPRWDRWGEYAVSAACMIVVIAGNTGTSNVWVLSLLYVAQGTLCFLGYVVEVLDYASLNVSSNAGTGDYTAEDGTAQEGATDVAGLYNTEYKPRPLDAALNPKDTPKRPVHINIPFASLRYKPVHLRNVTLDGPANDVTNGSSYARDLFDDNGIMHVANVLSYAKTWVFLVGMYIYGMIWITIGYNLFGNLLHKFDCLNGGSQYTIIPEIIFITEGGLFMLFAAAQCYLNFVRDRSVRLQSGFLAEYVYSILSLVSKVDLSVILIYQAHTQNIS